MVLNHRCHFVFLFLFLLFYTILGFFLFQSLTPGLAPLKGEGSLAPLRDSSPGRSLGSSLGASSPAGGTLGGTALGTGPLGGSSLGRGSLGGGSLGGGPLGGSLGKGSLGAGSMGGLGSGGRLSNAERHMDPFQQAPLGVIKDPPGVSVIRLHVIVTSIFCIYYVVHVHVFNFCFQLMFNINWLHVQLFSIWLI